MYVKRLCSLVFALFVLSLSAATITDPLMEAMKSASDKELIPINIRLSEQYNSNDLLLATRGMDRVQKREYVVSELKAFAEDRQEGLLDQLAASRGDVQNLRPLWITNVVSCHTTADVISQIALRKEIESIDLDEKRNMLDAREKESSVRVEGQPGSREITWNVSHVGATDVWALGYHGEGVTVAVIDTGVNYNHHDLQDHMWTNASYPNHGYDFINGDNDPMDDADHGTHCAGTVAGDGTAGSQTGIAPEATIMALKVLDSGGSGTESAVWNAIQFAVNQGANMISMSLGWQHSWGVDRPSWRDSFNNVLAAGMVACVAAGNEGDEQGSYPIPDNVRTPGDCPPPWLHPDQTLTGGLSSVICVGATDSSDNLAYFSSLGPCTWEDVSGYGDYAYNPGMGIIRPDISAPGYNIKSLDYSNNTGYLDGWNGTSMATPCNSGVVALMLSKNPNLTPAEIDQIIEQNAVQLSSSKSNSFGSGRVNALAAVNAVPAGTDPPNAATNPTPTSGSTTIGIPAMLKWNNGGGASSYTVFIGTNNGAPWNLVNGQTTSTPYISVSGLNYLSTYYWRVDSHNANGDATGTIWSFTTGAEADENFETGDFTANDWFFEGDAEWTIDSSNAYEGGFCAKSGVISHNEETSMAITLNCAGGSTISFYSMVSSEASYDYLHFYVDDDQEEQWCGEEPWTYHAYYVSEPGTHTFRWTYDKDGSESDGSDCARVDFVYFPEPLTGDPSIHFTPTQIDFGQVVVGGSSSASFQISNTGGETLSGTVFAPEGYRVSSSLRDVEASREQSRNVLGFAIPTGASMTLHLFFEPTAVATYNDEVTISSNDPENSEVSISLFGTGINPATITYTPGSFTETLDVDETASQTLTLGNDGDETLTYQVTYASSDRSRDDLFSEDFNSGIPGTWTITDGGTTTDTWYGEDAYGSSSSSLDGTMFAFSNSDAAGSGQTTDEILTSPSIDCSGYTNIMLEFDQFFNYIDGYGTEQGDVEVWDGATWQNVWTSGLIDWGSWALPDHQTIDLTEYANSALQIRFHYYAVYDLFWAIDNVSITGDFSGPLWLTLNGGTSASGSIAASGADEAVQIGFNSTGLSYGTYNATINVASNDPNNGSVDIPVSLVVSDAPQEQEIVVSPLSFEKSIVAGNTANETLTIDNIGGMDLTWSAVVTEVASRDIDLFDFDSGLPTGWNILDYGVTGLTWENVTDYEGASFDGTPFMLVNSGAYPEGVQFYDMIQSSMINTAGYSSITLELDHLFKVRTNELAQIYVHDGSEWHGVANFSSDQGTDFNSFAHPVYDLSEYAGNVLQIMFYYYDNNNQGYYWAIDNVQLNLDENPVWLTLDGGESASGTIEALDPAVPITVGFDAQNLAIGDYSKNITITSNDTDEGTIVVPVTLHVTSEPEPEIIVNPASLAFGTLEIGQTDTKQFTIQNTGLAILTGSIVTPSGYTVTLATRSRASVREGVKTRNSLTFSIDAGNTATYNLTFEPLYDQSYNGNVVIANNAGADEIIAVTGEGVTPPTAAITWNPASFNAAQEPDTQTSQNLTIGNNGALALTYEATVDYPSRSRTDLIDESFDSGMPGDWTIEDGGGTTDTWEVVSAYDTNTLDGTPFAFLDSDGAGQVDMDESLITPTLDVTDYTSLTLEFDQYFYYYQTEIADVDVWNGSSWDNLLSMSGAAVGSWSTPDHKTIDLTSYINSELKVRFHYYNANYEWYWAVDNVEIYGEGGPVSSTWLTLDGGESVNSTIASGGSDDVISVGFDSDNLTTGSYSAYIVLTSNDPDHASETIPVTLVIDEVVPDIDATPLSFNYTLEPDQTDQGTIQLMNLDAGTLNWSASVTQMSRNLVDAGYHGMRSGGTSNGQSDVPILSTSNTTFNGIRATGDLLLQYDVNAPTGSVLHLGCEVFQGQIWTTAGGLTSSSDDSNYLYRFDSNGNLLNTYDQITTSQWGLRDMAHDGTYLYAGDDNGFYRIDPATGAQTMLFSSNFGLGCIRALSYVPSMGFITCNWNNTYGEIIVFDASGNILDELAIPTSISNIYGSAYDPSDHTLWFFDISGPDEYQLTTFYQYDIATEALTGESIVVPVLVDSIIEQQAGGACLTSELTEGKMALCGIAQTEPDTFFAVELRDAVNWISLTSGTSGSLSGNSGPAEIGFSIDTADMVDGETHSAEIVISSNDPDEPTIVIPVNLTIETYPAFNLTPSSLTFGDVPLQTSETLQFTIENNGFAEMSGTITTIDGYTVSEISTTRTGSARKEVASVSNGRNALSYLIPGYSSQTFDLTLTPVAEETYNGSIVITSNDTNYPSNQLAVTGTGVYLPFPDIEVTPVLLSFNVDPDDTQTKTFAISNVGEAGLNYSISEGIVASLATRTELTGALSSSREMQRTDWIGFDPTSGTVAVDSYQIISVTANTAGMTSGDYQTMLEIQTNDPDEAIVEVQINLRVKYQPLPIDDLSIQIDAGTVYLTWSTTTYATQYVIYAAASPEGPYTQVGQTNITVWSTAASEEMKYFMVKAKN